MKRLTLITSIVLLGWGLIPALVFAQAAVEYGMAASKSTAITSRASSSVASRSRSALSRAAKLPALRIPPPTSKSPEVVMQENRQKLEEKSRSGGGKVQIESVPEKASVFIDGDLVAVAPAELSLPEGKHLIELSHPGYNPWRMDVTVNRQESTSVTAQMENRYRSSITLSFPK